MRALPRQTYAILAAAVFAVAAIHQLVSMVTNHPALHLVTGASWVVAILDAVLFAATAITLVLRRRTASLLTLSWTLGIFSVAALALSALLFAPFGAPLLGLVYAAAAALSAFLLKRSFDRGLLRHIRDVNLRMV